MPENIEGQLLIEEYKSCRDLLAKNIEIMEKSEIYAIGAVAASAVYCLSSKNPTVVVLSSWLPFSISFLGLIRFLGLNSIIGTLNDYFEFIEARRENKIVWTTYYRDNRKPVLAVSRWGYGFF